MNKSGLVEILDYITNGSNGIGTTLYGEFKPEDVIFKFNVKSDDLPSIQKLFLEEIKENIINNEELSVIPLSSADERKNAIYYYDLDKSEALNAIHAVVESDEDDIKIFNFEEGDLGNLKAFIVEIGNDEHQVVLYKIMANVNIYGRSGFFIKKSKDRFEKSEDEFLRITPNFQLMEVDGHLFVINVEALEKRFGYHEIIKSEAIKGIETIESIGVLENPETLRELVSDLTFARKMTKISSNSPVIKLSVPNTEIIDFCKHFPDLKGRIRFNEDESKIVLDTKVSKTLFIQLLMDNFLTSELTKSHYKSLAKDPASEVLEQQDDENIVPFSSDDAA
ncbi:DUF4868 domain-containing protein [Vibrio alginolyticus]|uniref:anti-phage protein KwaB n=2 Tax=Vibrio harveyi group TaxID=717610 RepID=UPI0022AE9C32|nr:anti-phage protein KwaB [Vibrio alginolyticus]MCZ4390692.1 DUF4868 domain-containing protein [Vibrio alginolyticus]